MQEGAGDPQRGVAILSDAIRNGENTSKIRQNLAYALALMGDWRQSRVMASMDIPEEQVGDRMQEWLIWPNRVRSNTG